MSDTRENIEISVVIPVYGCPTAIPALHERLTNVLTSMNVSYEIIMVDDCDKMNSLPPVSTVPSENG